MENPMPVSVFCCAWMENTVRIIKYDYCVQNIGSKILLIISAANDEKLEINDT